MDNKERRTNPPHPTRALRSDLNEAQLQTLADLERFGWQLKFVRRPMFQPSIPVVFDPDLKTYALLEADGSLNEHPLFDIRGE